MKNKIKFIAAFIVFNMNIAKAQTPINDICANATPLLVSAICAPVVGTVLNATQSLAPITCGPGTSSKSNDVWFSFLAASPNATIVAAPNNQLPNTFNLVMSLYSSCSGSLVTCADIYGNLQPETIISNSLTVGNTYYVSVYQYKNSVSSPVPANPTFSICVIDDVIITNLREQSLDNSLISPNPVTNVINVNTTLLQNTASVALFDINGKQVFFTTELTPTINIEFLSTGLYYVVFHPKNLSDTNKAVHKKIVKL